MLRKWGQSHREVLERYIAGVIEGTRWATSPANGVAPGARLDMQGFRNVLALRAQIEGSWGGKAPAPGRYVDLSYYEGAMKRLK